MLVDSIKHREIPEQKWFEKAHCKVVVQRKAFVQVKCGGGVTQRKWFLNLFSLWNIKDDSLCRQKKKNNNNTKQTNSKSVGSKFH